MRFYDRRDAGKQLAQRLQLYKDDLLGTVIGLPRGGVVVAYEIARALHLPLDIVVPRKIGAPGQPELAVGAVTQEGTPLFMVDVMARLGLTPEDVQQTIEKEQKEAQRRLQVYRGDRESLSLHGKHVIVVDDGIATGATMDAALQTIHKAEPKKIIVAVPVCPPEKVRSLENTVDEVVALQQPAFFGGIGSFYTYFPQTSDEQVMELMRSADEQVY